MGPKNPRTKQKIQLLGELLIKEGLVTREQLQAAIDVQQEEREKARHFNLSEYLVENKIIDQSKLVELETKYRLNQLLGEALVEDGIITEQQLKEALARKKTYQFLGEVLMKLGFIDKSQLYECLKQQDSVPSFQSILVQEELITDTQVKEIVLSNSLPRSIGEILADQGSLSVQKLYKALKKHNKRRPIGEMIVQAGLISEEQLDLALEKQKFTDVPLGETLIGESFISDIEFYGVLARQFAMKFIVIDEERLKTLDANRLKQVIGAKEALRYRVIPLGFEKKMLNLGMFNPYDIERLEGFDSIINFDISLTLIRESDFETAYKHIYGAPPNWEDVESDLEEMIADSMNLSLEDDEKESDSMYVVADKDNEAEKLANLIISYGIKARASDIHIENDPKGIHVRYRIDGMLRELKDPSIRRRMQAKALPLVSRIKVMSDLDIAERRLPQDGSFRLSMFDAETKSKINLDIRVAICRGAYGENVVMRILDSRKANVRLDQLSHSIDLLTSFVQVLKNPAGMILVTGPTGSGKSSSLYAGLHYLNNPSVKIITAEDPVEFKVAGIMQTQAESKIGLTFARLLRSFLRLDPDIIMVGEIRDAETAEIAIEAALTGHLVLSTLHTTDAIGSISRLRDLGMSNLQIASALKAVLSQRLVREICKHCKQPYVPDPSEWDVMFPEEPVHLKFFRGEGCQKCNQSGYLGRLAISELFLLQPSVVNVILDNADTSVIYRAARAEGMKSILEDGLTKLDKTTLPELSRVVPPDTVGRFRTEYGQLYSRFPPFETPKGASLEYQMLLSRSQKGFSNERIHDLYTHYRNLRKRLMEGTDHINEAAFNEFLHARLQKTGGGNGVNQFRVSLLNRNRRTAIMVEAAGE